MYHRKSINRFMKKDTLINEINDILSEGKNDSGETLVSFKDYLHEKTGFSPMIKTGSFFILLRLRSLRDKIKSEKEVAKKLDLLAKQNLYLGALLSISISFDTKDKTILQKGKSIIK